MMATGESVRSRIMAASVIAGVKQRSVVSMVSPSPSLTLSPRGERLDKIAAQWARVKRLAAKVNRLCYAVAIDLPGHVQATQSHLSQGVRYDYDQDDG